MKVDQRTNSKNFFYRHSSERMRKKVGISYNYNYHPLNNNNNIYNELYTKSLANSKFNAKDFSFKGKAISSNNFKNYNSILNKLDNILLNGSARKLFNHVMADSKAAKGITIGKDGSISFKEKSIPKKILDSSLYPFVKMPIDLLNFTLRQLKKLPFVKKNGFINSIYNSKILKNRRELLKRETDVHNLRGLLERGESILEKSDKEAKKKLLGWSHKMFNPATGNYNTVHERPLARLVSGSIPAFFLANDAYNLSQMCTNDKKEAEYEKKLRFRQELKRVGLTAYLQLALLGAFTRAVNSTSWAVPLISVSTVLLSETTSRYFSGKPITFLSKESAKKYNKYHKTKLKEKHSDDDDKKAKENKKAEEVKYHTISFRNSQSFASFKSSAFEKFQTRLKEPTKVEKEDKKESKEKEDKSLLNIKNLLIYAGTSIGIGFGLKYGRKIKAIDKPFAFIENGYKKILKKLSKKEFEVSREDFNKITKRLRDNGFDKLAETYEKAIEKQKGDTIKLGNVNSKISPLVLAADEARKFGWGIFAFPYRLASGALFKGKGKSGAKEIDHLTNAVSTLLKKSKKMDDEGFKKYVNKSMLNSFNYETISNQQNNKIASTVQLFSSAAASYFLIADHYNMVMIKSDGEDKKGAAIKGKERFVQRLSSIFHQSLCIKLFNNAFRNIYNGSLLGVSSVITGSSLTNEVISRTAIGVPIKPSTRDEMLALEHKRASQKGIKGAYFRFFNKLVGKKTISEKASEK